MSVLLLLVVTDGAVERQGDDDCVLEIIEQAIVYAFDRLTATDLPHDYGGDTGVIITADGIHEMVYPVLALIGLYREHDIVLFFIIFVVKYKNLTRLLTFTWGSSILL